MQWIRSTRLLIEGLIDQKLENIGLRAYQPFRISHGIRILHLIRLTSKRLQQTLLNVWKQDLANCGQVSSSSKADQRTEQWSGPPWQDRNHCCSSENRFCVRTGFFQQSLISAFRSVSIVAVLFELIDAHKGRP